jgi:hypothetical protein
VTAPGMRRLGEVALELPPPHTVQQRPLHRRRVGACG